jgi:hypothetical protein
MDFFMKDIKKAKNKYIIEIKRKKISSDITRGIILDYSSNNILLACLNDCFYLNGYTLIRKKDITDYCINDESQYFLFRAQQELGLYPKYSFNVDLNNIKSVCEEIHNFSPLITVFKEKSEDIAAYIGVITKITECTFSLYEIDSNAEWDKEHILNFQKISKINWGGGYENALWQVGKKDIPKECAHFVNGFLP